MLDVALWYLIFGVLLTLTAVVVSFLKPLPITTDLVYILVGVTLGPYGAGLFTLDPIADATLLEHVTEIAVIVSLFATGLTLRLPLSHSEWRIPLRLAFISMILTVGAVALAGHFILGLPLAAGLLLGAVLAPTDPVLASDVQVEDPSDRDRLRFGLTGEAGLNDGTAFPFVVLGLWFLRPLDRPWGLEGWFVIDLLWAVVAGLAVGALFGWGVAKFVIHLRRRDSKTSILDDFLALGLIGLSYGSALAIHAYGFLAVFAAGLAFRQIERRHMGEQLIESPAELVQLEGPGASHIKPELVPAVTAQAVMIFSEQSGRLMSMVTAVLLGTLLRLEYLSWSIAGLIALVFVVIRPLAVALGLVGTRTSRGQLGLIGWFGVRGIGSLYYLSYATAQGIPRGIAETLIAVTYTGVAASAVLHGISVTPLMSFYRERLERRGRRTRDRLDTPAQDPA